jgi:pantothenate synthetase (EC 6.3.2.1)
MKIIKSKEELQKAINLLRDEHKTIGFIPTMGALHQGHLSLLAAAQQKGQVGRLQYFCESDTVQRQEGF